MWMRQVIPTQMAFGLTLIFLTGSLFALTSTSYAAKSPVLIQSRGETPFIGTVVKHTAILFPLDPTLPFTDLTYTVPVRTTVHLIMELTPDSGYDVVTQTVDNKTQVTITPGTTYYANSSGVLVWVSEIAFPEDVNLDGAVNVFDLVLVGLQLGMSGADLSGDVNDDEVVNVLDLVLVGVRLGETTIAAGPSRMTLGSGNAAVSQKEIAAIQRALTELEGLAAPPRGAEIAKQFLRAWLANATSTIKETKLLPNYPNPFNPETWIPYQLAFDSPVQILIYDIRGAQVRRLDLGHQRAGYYMDLLNAAHWDGRSETGERVASGLYFYQLKAGNFTTVRRMAILK